MYEELSDTILLHGVAYETKIIIILLYLIITLIFVYVGREKKADYEKKNKTINHMAICDMVSKKKFSKLLKNSKFFWNANCPSFRFLCSKILSCLEARDIPTLWPVFY